jgi:hypothetical protein
MEMKCRLYLVTQVSDVAHRPHVCFASFESPKTYQPLREKNKQEKITKSMQIYQNCV